ncbi:unnamed protein product [Mytilus edulis]|uniref:B box-type domain-containing protein n=1 Tax=Mytilus edulis TaxID=6550 RepID=A0A8S3T2M3_MYTED|nr:unnamed protein product [Mytilus edulis]
MASKLPSSRSKSTLSTTSKVVTLQTSDEACGPCKRDSSEDYAFCWCIDCAEGLCSDCEKHHKKSKTSITHRLIPLLKLKDISDFLRNFTQTCCDHTGGSFTFYCKSHDKLCCPGCVTIHQKECHEIITLGEASVDAKKNGKIEDLGLRMKEALTTLNELENHKKDNIGMINAQRNGIRTTLSEMRRKVNDYLDSLEMRIEEKLLQAHKECIEKLETQTKDLVKRTEILKTWQSDITMVKDYGSDTHSFVMSKSLENLMTELETFNRRSTENFVGLSLSFVTSTTFENLQNTVHALGEISVNKSSTELIITPRKSARIKSKLIVK